MFIEKLCSFPSSLLYGVLIIQKSTYDNRCHKLERENVSSKVSLCLTLMDVYPRSSDSFSHEYLLAKLADINCLI